MYTLHLGGSGTAQLPSNSKPLPSDLGLPPQLHRTTRGGGAGQPKPLYNHQLEPPKNQYRSNDFDRFWELYPVKVGKKSARAIWQKIKPDADVLIADIQERLARDSKWKKGYILNPTKYLKEESWNDEITDDRKPATSNPTLSTPQSRGREAIERKHRRDNGTTMATDA